jgi:PAS domain S-box-containing protein
MAEAADAAERRAAQAEQAAAAAAEAANLARRSAEEAGAEAQAVRRAVEAAAGGRGYEAVPALAPYRGHGVAEGGQAQPATAEGTVAAGPPANGGPSGDDTDPRRPLFGPKRDTVPAREARPGFDNVKEPLATIEMDGRFRELNQAFSDLVGYSEEDFKSASWPPVMDRANLPKHREQMKRMISGEIESADVNTGYVHAQGLLVPVIGTISLVKVEGEPDHFLLVAKS